MPNIAVIACCYLGTLRLLADLVWWHALQAPVAVYTAGKTSSGPGLTGSMLKKPNGQFYLEVTMSACMTACCVTTHLERSFIKNLSVTSQLKCSLVKGGNLLLQYQQLSVTRHAAIAFPSSITWQLSGFWGHYVWCADSC